MTSEVEAALRGAEPPTRAARAFGRTLRAMHQRLGGDPAAAGVVERWAARAWQEADAGHVCAQPDEPALLSQLAASPVVGPASGPLPLVLDGDALYLHRLWRAETQLAAAVSALDAPAPLAAPDALARALDDVCGGCDGQQRRALECALGRRLTVLSGGPGTGKTTTLARLLVAFARLAPRGRVAYAAPTGKAAARLAQSLAAQLARLDPHDELRARLPASGQTVHRLLGLRGGDAASEPGALDFDLVIVDEASMLDLELAARLCEAVGPRARVVLAGDRDQLASVEAGAVFADLCAAPLGGVVVLERNYRQQDAAHIAALAAWVRDAHPGARAPALALADPDPLAIVDQAWAAWRDAFAAVADGADAGQVLAAFDAHRVLAALRDGALGVDALNRALAQRARRLAGVSASAQWYPGRLVMVTRNVPALGLFNGDVGVCLPHGQGGGNAPGLVVAVAGAEGIRLFPVLQMPACEDAWAITVHKAQGSEFESVALVPAPAGHPLNTRELLYTGITRARRRLGVWAEPAALDEAVRRPTQRRARLAQRLAGTGSRG